MIRLRLGVAAVAQSPAAVAAAAYLAPRLARPFEIGSGHDISLTPQLAELPTAKKANGAVSSDTLNRALEKVTGSQTADDVRAIGLLIADTYEARSDAFGYMFDQDFVPGSSTPWQRVPREGCAVFIGAIAANRNGQDFHQELEYTAIHEIGHIFNLQHSAAGSYMATSADRSTAFDLSATDFNDNEKKQLARCSSDPHVRPGGSAFGLLGTIGKGLGGADAANVPSHLRLEIGADELELWPFEPLELDISIRAAPSARGRSFITDVVDPGYTDFVVWIKEPSGEVRRYRSPRHYCGPRRRVSIAPHRPFDRDLSLFAESGGWTFRQVGQHVVWATLRVGRSVLTSNDLQFFIKPPADGDHFYSAANALFTDTAVARLMYYRRLDRTRSKRLPAIDAFCERFKHTHAAAIAHYVSGRALAHAVRRLSRADTRVEARRRDARKHLNQAANHPKLGDHRRAHAQRALEAIDT